VVGCCHGYLSGTRCRFSYCPADATATHYPLLQEIQIGFTKIVLLFWCQLPRVALEKRPLNECSVVVWYKHRILALVIHYVFRDEWSCLNSGFNVGFSWSSQHTAFWLVAAAVHGPVCHGSVQSQHTQFRWNTRSVEVSSVIRKLFNESGWSVWHSGSVIRRIWTKLLYVEPG